MSAAYYNEIDPYAAQWLRNLIAAGHIAPGEVDERSIEDVKPDDLMGFTQCHFFAGIGVWSHSLRRAGWSDDRPVWTGSCPCQPFSAAGKGDGFADERHLWPAWFHLINQCRPAVVLGEQVASKDGLGWLDLVQSDMEAAGYAFGAVDTCAAGFGAPHIRQRLYFVGTSHALANPECDEQRSGRRARCQSEARNESGAESSGCGAPVELERATSNGRKQRGAEPIGGSLISGRCIGGLADPNNKFKRSAGDTTRIRNLGGDRKDIGMADTNGGDTSAEREQCGGEQRQQPQDGGYDFLGDTERAGLEGHARNGDRASGRTVASGSITTSGDAGRPGPVNGFWRNSDWLHCRDGKWRPVESGTFPLVDGAAFKLGSGSAYAGKSRAKMLKGYGNAINAEQATGFIGVCMEVLG